MLGAPSLSEPLRAVFDTNVLLSLFAFVDSRFAPVRAALDDGAIIAVTRQDCLDEWRRVLAYRDFSFTPERQQAAFAAYQRMAVMCGPPAAHAYALPRCRDRDDQKFLEVARDGTAHHLVTADGALLALRQKRPLAEHVVILLPDRYMDLVLARRTKQSEESRDNIG
jgi:uncharacterized protein